MTSKSADGAEWLLRGGNFRGEHFSPLAQVNDESVTRLGLDWSVDLSLPNGIAATPLMVDGVICLSGALSIVYAIDAASGETLWRFGPGMAPSDFNSWTRRVNRCVSVSGDKVLVSVVDCRLIGLDRATGREVWSKMTCDPAQGYSITDAPHVGGMVFVAHQPYPEGVPGDKVIVV